MLILTHDIMDKLDYLIPLVKQLEIECSFFQTPRKKGAKYVGAGNSRSNFMVLCISMIFWSLK